MNDDEIRISEITEYTSGELPPIQLYTGPCSVVPGISDQVLETYGKLVNQNVSVSKIPYSEVTTSGTDGMTITIG